MVGIGLIVAGLMPILGPVQVPGMIVVAERIVWCGPGWRAEFRDTTVRQRVRDTCLRPRDYERRYAIQDDNWSKISGAIRESEFWSLPERIDVSNPDGTITVVTDDDDMCIDVSAPQQRRRVCGSAFALGHTDLGRRFMRVWAELVQIAPEPKP